MNISKKIPTAKVAALLLTSTGLISAGPAMAAIAYYNPEPDLHAYDLNPFNSDNHYVALDLRNLNSVQAYQGDATRGSVGFPPASLIVWSGNVSFAPYNYAGIYTDGGVSFLANLDGGTSLSSATTGWADKIEYLAEGNDLFAALRVDAAGGSFNYGWLRYDNIGTDFYIKDFGFETTFNQSIPVGAVPIPAAVWLFGSAMAGLGVIGKRRAKGESA